MVLSLKDHRAMLKGFEELGYSCLEEPSSPTNPVIVEWNIGTQRLQYRLWVFDITHGGGGPTVRAADEFRIQITNGPQDGFDTNGRLDLLLGYSRDRDSIVAYDRRWLENWVEQKSASPSVQVKEADIQAGHDEGIHHLTKATQKFGQADIVTMSPSALPAYLRNPRQVLSGQMNAAVAQSDVPKGASDDVAEYCRDQGFPFEQDLLARYIASFLAKPMVILAGVSGTGKSKLAELVAEFYAASTAAKPGAPSKPITSTKFVFGGNGIERDRTRSALVAVRPDWIDNQSILGFVNPITERYESTQTLDLILRADRALKAAESGPEAPRYFLLLDEMNLARVEHYFSDWLSCTESRRYIDDGSIYQQPVPLHRSSKALETTIVDATGAAESIEVPQSITLPTNLVVTGTVNVDETTYGFSPKVLDRAMVIEFDDVDLDRLRSSDDSVGEEDYRLPKILPPFEIAQKEDYAELPASVHAHLVAINKILEAARLHFGYRSANEIALFMRFYREFLPEAPEDAEWLRPLDVAVLQKILPRLQGNRAKVEAALAGLCGYLRDLKPAVGDPTTAEFSPDAEAKLPRSYQRALDMLLSLRDFGFVTFFK